MNTAVRTSRLAATALVAAVTGIGLLAPTANATAYTPKQAPAQGSAQRSAHAQNTLQEQVDALQRTGTVGAIALSARPGHRTFAAAGVADTTTGRPARPGDRFRVGSITKTFVSTVMLQLVAEGRVSLDDTVDHRLPGVVSGNGNDGRKITLRQLLNHTSGLFDYTRDLPEFTSVDRFQADRYTAWAPDQLVAVAMRHAPHFAPGTAWEYSNTNYILAGIIIQKVTGHTWQHEVTHRILRPLGLHDTFAPVHSPRIPGPHLEGYSAFGGPGPAIDVSALDPSAAGSAGGMISTTADLSRFYSALLGGRLLPPAQLAEMKTTVPAPTLDPTMPDARYGLGLIQAPLPCGGFFYGHGGDIPGYIAIASVSADGRRTAVVESTGDGSPDLSSEQARVDMLGRQICAADHKQSHK
ncbi:serine hydrolase domain-containing protein [Streptantibioticus ferralitis]|uniref:Serine hydrolase n=1 Tax=Streptantibioticus ferralitis TaxID=236510 RepID=A0ABT5Z0Y5_9ACTN|nr:serine hydrolase domain-containing protein [Streptantibioticus ferralitis]MDF2257418.1 serine hydrolase [Streptantibioticus ferralitis]